MENFQVTLTQRPGADNAPEESNFEYSKCEMPAELLKSGEVKVQTLYLSVDPAQRCQMNENTLADYLSPWSVGSAVIGLCGLGCIIQSSHPQYNKGDLIQGIMEWPWKKYFTINADEQQKFYKNVDPALHKQPTLCFGILNGLTSIIGVREVGKVKPGDVFVVSGAAGSCGSIAGQIARHEGAEVIGICGSDEKCKWLTDKLGFKNAINYKKDNVDEKLSQICPGGVDVYFDNVGGEISNSVIKLMKKSSIVVLCGQISQYNKDVPYPQPLSEDIKDIIQKQHIQRDRFLVLHHEDKFTKYTAELVEMLSTGKLVFRETITEGLENAGKAFVSMMQGGNIGKQLVKL